MEVKAIYKAIELSLQEWVLHLHIIIESDSK